MDEQVNEQDAQAEVPAQDLSDSDTQLAELMADLQRTRADFENYRKRVELEKTAARDAGAAAMIVKLLPVIDTIDRATSQIPADIADHKWVEGVAKVPKTLEKALASVDVKKIAADSGENFNPEVHDAIQFDEDSEGDTEVIDEVLQSGYTHKGSPIRHTMVKVTRK